MKFIRFFFLLLALTLVFCCVSMPAALACGGAKDCCKKEVSKTVRQKTCCAQNHSTKKHKDCDGNCGDKGCSCPTLFSIFAIPASAISLKLTKPVFSLSTKADWYYRQVIPKSVFLSIWLPPKISC